MNQNNSSVITSSTTINIYFNGKKFRTSNNNWNNFQDFQINICKNLNIDLKNLADLIIKTNFGSQTILVTKENYEQLLLYNTEFFVEVKNDIYNQKKEMIYCEKSILLDQININIGDCEKKLIIFLSGNNGNTEMIKNTEKEINKLKNDIENILNRYSEKAIEKVPVK